MKKLVMLNSPKETSRQPYLSAAMSCQLISLRGILKGDTNGIKEITGEHTKIQVPKRSTQQSV